MDEAYRVWNPEAGARRRALRSEEVRAIAARRRRGSTMAALREKRREEGSGNHTKWGRERETMESENFLVLVRSNSPASDGINESVQVPVRSGLKYQ